MVPVVDGLVVAAGLVVAGRRRGSHALFEGAGVALAGVVAEGVGVEVLAGAPLCCCAFQVSYELMRAHSVQLAVVDQLAVAVVVLDLLSAKSYCTFGIGVQASSS